MKGSDDLKHSEQIMIPKTRFDEINGKYKEAKERIRVLEKEVQEIKSKSAKEKTLLQLKGIFVDGGFKKEEYEGIVKRISCSTDEEKLALAREIVKIKS